MIADIVASSALISSKIDRLKAKEVELLKESKKTQEAMKAEKARLERNPTLIGQARNELSTLTRQAMSRHQASKSVPSSDAEDQQQIAKVDAIHLRSIEMIQNRIVVKHSAVESAFKLAMLLCPAW
jgi:chromosome segregation ATPase